MGESRWAHRLRIKNMSYLSQFWNQVAPDALASGRVELQGITRIIHFVIISELFLCSPRFLQPTAYQRRRAIFTAQRYSRLAWSGCEDYSQTSAWRCRPILQVDYIWLARRTHVRGLICDLSLWKQGSLSSSSLSRHRWCRFHKWSGHKGLIDLAGMMLNKLTDFSFLFQMLNFFNGKERTERDFRELGEATGWKLQSVISGVTLASFLYTTM